MTLEDIQNEINSRYSEIYNRIEKYFDKLKYVTYTDEDWILYDWHFNYTEEIEVLMRDSDGYEDTAYISPKFLENDEIFEKWLDDEGLKRKAEEAEQKKNDEQKREARDFKLYQQLKDKFNDK